MNYLSEESKFELSIVIVSYKVKEYLRNCLASIYNTTNDIAYEVLVMDNNSADGTTHMVEKEFPKVKLFANKENIGFVRANNLCIKNCKGNYILMLNPDTVIIRNSLRKMIHYIELNPNTGAMGCKMLNTDKTIQPSCYNFPSLREIFGIYFFGNKMFSGLKNINHYKIQEIDFVRGAFLFLNKKCLEKIGLLDENFFMFGEETDLCFRMNKRGWKVIYYPETVIIHHRGKSIVQVFEKSNLQRIRSLIYYFQKNYGKFSAFIVRLIVFSGVGLRLLLRKIILDKNRVAHRRTISKKTQFEILKLTLGLTK